MLTILSNKYKIETSEHLMKIIDTRADALSQLLQPASQVTSGAAASHLDAIAAIAAGMLRRNSGKQAQALLRVLKESLQSSTSSSSATTAAARRLEVLVVPQDILSKENFAVVRPLWTQKTYFDVVKPLLATALKPSNTADVRANVSVGVLLMVRHMSFTVYEDDAEDILRVAISVAQRGAASAGSSSADVRASLHVLKDILIADKDKGRLHLKSIVSICVDIFSSTSSGVRPDPHCVKLALEITGGLPNMFEAQHLLMYRLRVERELALACGNPVREARKTARLAREAWERLK